MIIIIGRILLLPYKINKSIKPKIKIIALILLNVFSFFLNHLCNIVYFKYNRFHCLIICANKYKNTTNTGIITLKKYDSHNEK